MSLSKYRNNYYLPVLLLLISTLASCAGQGDQPVADTLTAAPDSAVQVPPAASRPNGTIADAATIIARQQVPILCYHQIRDWKPTDSKSARDYIVPVDKFRAQMKMLADSGYQTILPDQLYDYLAYGTPLPEKPVMLTFDDNDLDQYTVAFPELKKYGFKGVFFIMTVTMGKPRYMSREQIREISDAGHVIGSHTWDHKNVKKFEDADWPVQVDKPSKQLEEITGKKIEYFAYPFGLWKPEVIPGLKQRGMKAAFQLSSLRDPNDPLHTIRRIIVPGQWSEATMYRAMRGSFK
jgi:peptidoglycan/xylan/chitin deacetylase (PgdA/CDA1 family)